MHTCSYCKSDVPHEGAVLGPAPKGKKGKQHYFCDTDCLDLWKRECGESLAKDCGYRVFRNPERADRGYHGKGHDSEEHLGGRLGVRAPNDRPEKDWEPGVVILKTKARDNHGHEYHVTLEKKPGKWNPSGEPVLVVGNTGGRWFMSTLMESGRRHNEIWIDMGQGWKIINFGDVFQEALTLV